MWKYAIGTIIAALVLYIYLIFPETRRKREIWKYRGTQWAHRGLHENQAGIPENSMAAFRQAIRAKMGIELDVHLTRDHKLVVFHDDTLQRMCGVSGSVEEKTWEELKTLHLLDTAESIPLLKDVFHLVKGKVPILIEVKLLTEDTAICRFLVEELKAYGGQVLVQSFNSLVLRWFRKYETQILRGQLSSNLVKSEETPHYMFRFCVKYLLSNCICRPDFISYKMEDSNNLSLWMQKHIFHVPVAAWTLHGEEMLQRAKSRFDMYIFEKN